MENSLEPIKENYVEDAQEATSVKVEFSDTEKAFAHLSNKELSFAHFIFSLMRSDFLVKNLSKLALLSIRLHLPVSWAIKSTIFKQFCGGENFAEAGKTVDKLGKYNVKSILDYSVEAAQREYDYERTKIELLRIINFAKDNEQIPVTSMKVTGIGRFALLEKVSSKEELTPEEKREFALVVGRLDEICTAGKEAGVGIYIDAEESWIQDAIDGLAEAMMAKFNKAQVVVFTTLQMYRHDRLDYLKTLIGKTIKGNYLLGVKFVRGAYLEKENARAKSKGYLTPMQPTKGASDQDYNLAIEMAVKNLDRVSICAGTHNEHSCQLLVNLMAQMEIPKNHPHIWFSQLYGMSDNISFTLASEGYNVSKYLPYGPVKDTLPYLIRRADENKSVGGQMGKELTLIKQEIERRKHAKSK